MADISKTGYYKPEQLAEAAFHFGKKGEDGPVLALLQQGADPDAVDRFGFTALLRATQFDRLEVMRALLQGGASLNTSNRHGITPLMAAQSAEAVRLLVRAGADVDAMTVSNKSGLSVGRTALMMAVTHNIQDAVETLLAEGANHRLRDKEGCSALMLAAHGEHHETVRLLLDVGAEVGMIEAVMLGDIESVRQMLAAGGDLQQEIMGESLQWATKARHDNIIELLLDRGADVEFKDAHGYTALMQAAVYGRNENLRLLLARGANPNATDQGGRTTLMHCLHSDAHRNQQGVELLLAHGADVGVRSKSGWTPLMLACLHGDTEAAETLLARGADPNVFTDEQASEAEGCTTTSALMLAALNSRLKIVQMLLRYGADIHAPNSGGTTVLDLMQRRQQHGPRHEHNAAILALLQTAANTSF